MNKKLGRKRIFKNKVTFPLEMEKELRDLIKKMATMQGKTMKDYITENILLDIKGYCIFCPVCKAPVLDSRIINIKGQLTLTCPDCGHQWEHVEEE